MSKPYHSLPRRYARERPALDRFCSAHGFQLSLQGNVLQIFSRYDCWRLIRTRSGALELYHKNAYRIAGPDEGRFRGYHLQPFQSDTILGFLERIASHDEYRVRSAVELNRSEPNMSRRHRAQFRRQQKERLRSTGIRQTLSLIEELHTEK